MTQWIRRHRDNVRATIQCRGVDALISRETTHKMTFQNKEALGIFRAIGAIGVFPGQSVQVVVGGNKQDAFWRIGKSALSECLRWKEGSVEGLAIGGRVVKGLWEPLLLRN